MCVAFPYNVSCEVFVSYKSPVRPTEPWQQLKPDEGSLVFFTCWCWPIDRSNYSIDELQKVGFYWSFHSYLCLSLGIDCLVVCRLDHRLVIWSRLSVLPEKVSLAVKTERAPSDTHWRASVPMPSLCLSSNAKSYSQETHHGCSSAANSSVLITWIRNLSTISFRNTFICLLHRAYFLIRIHSKQSL